MKAEDAERKNNVDTKPEQNEGSDPKGKSAPATAGIIDAANRAAGEKPATGKGNDSEYRDKGGIPRIWEIRIAAFLAIVNLGTLIVLIYQSIQMQKATKAATDGLKLTRHLAQIEQRAWVAPSDIQGKPVLGQPFTVDVIVRNTGATFAKEFYGMILRRSKKLSDPDPAFAALIDEEVAKQKANLAFGVIAPNSPFYFHIDVLPKATQVELDALADPTSLHFLFGKLFYKDVLVASIGRCSAIAFSPVGATKATATLTLMIIVCHRIR